MMVKRGLVNPVAERQTGGMAKGSLVSELRAWRAGQGLTLEEAGALIVVDGKPVDKATFHAWESGRKVPRGAFMFELERVTGVEPNAFYVRPPLPAANDRAALPPRQAVML